MDGLHDEPRSGAPRTIDDVRIEPVIVKTLESLPADATDWSSRDMATASWISVAGRYCIAKFPCSQVKASASANPADSGISTSCQKSETMQSLLAVMLQLITVNKIIFYIITEITFYNIGLRDEPPGCTVNDMP